MLKTKLNVLLLACFLASPFLCAQAIAAPHAHNRSQSEQAPKKDKTDNANVYRVAYRISELENGKTINSRSYTLMAKTGSMANTRVGSRIPVDVGAKGIQYQDVGIYLYCTVREQDGKPIIRTIINVSTVADAEAATSPGPPPIMRNLSLADDTAIVSEGKPTFVGSVDDVTSNRRYVVEVTVTKVM